MAMSNRGLELESWDQMMERMKEAIGKTGAGWTDWSPQDPGITILEMMAWLSQAQQYHGVQIGERHIRKYGKILGIHPRKRMPGHTLVTVEAPEGLWLMAGTRFYAGEICFETREDQMVMADRFLSFETEDAGQRKTLEGDWVREGKNISIHPFGQEPQKGNGITIEMETALEEQVLYRLFLGSEREGLVGYRPVEEAVFDGFGFFPLARFRMEFEAEEGWCSTKMLRDETYGMIQSGCICFTLPQPMRRDRYRLRLVLEESHYLVPPRITRVSLAMVPVWQQQTEFHFAMWEGNGKPHQCYELESRYIVEESLILAVGERQWTQVEDFDCSGSEDPHYQIDHGQIRFGDGIFGKVPEGVIQIRQIGFTFGEQGNSKAGSIRQMMGNPEFAVTNEWDVVGGTEEETVQQAIAGFWEKSCRGNRAVTWEDYEHLVLEIPGLLIEDCKVYSKHPEKREIIIAVKPYTEDGYGRLNQAYEKNLYRYLEEKRLIGSRLLLVSPEYCLLEVVCVAMGKVQYRNAKAVVEETVTAWIGKKQFGQGVRYEELKGLIGTLPCIRRVETLWLHAGTKVQRNQFGDMLVPPNGIVKLKRVVCSLIEAGGDEDG